MRGHGPGALPFPANRRPAPRGRVGRGAIGSAGTRREWVAGVGGAIGLPGTRRGLLPRRSPVRRGRVTRPVPQCHPIPGSRRARVTWGAERVRHPGCSAVAINADWVVSGVLRQAQDGVVRGCQRCVGFCPGTPHMDATGFRYPVTEPLASNPTTNNSILSLTTLAPVTASAGEDARLPPNSHSRPSGLDSPLPLA